MADQQAASDGSVLTTESVILATVPTPATSVPVDLPAQTHRQGALEVRTEGKPRLPLDYLPVSVLSRVVVRAFDLLVAAAAVALLLPLFVLVLVAVAASSDGAPMYTHRRLGRHARYFQCLKFRSMYPDADDRLAHILRTDPIAAAQWREHHKIKNDPRITPLGRFLRVTNLDEFPQLLNVLRGQMSIVGPRPIVEAEAARYGHHLSVVLAVKPGLTGLWQVSGRNDVSYDERVALDVEYVRSRNLARDLTICVKTALQMVRFGSNGAY